MLNKVFPACAILASMLNDHFQDLTALHALAAGQSSLMKRESSVDAYSEARNAVVEPYAVQGKTSRVLPKPKNFAGRTAAVNF